MESGKWRARRWPAAVLLIAFCLLPPKAYSARGKVTLAAVGDVLFARGVGKQITKHGPDWLFGNIRTTISSADLAFCNLECTLSDRGIPQHRRFQFRASPRLAEALHGNGFDVISLANNHTLDFGREAMLDTIDAVKNAGMTPVGAGGDRPDSLRLQVIAVNGLRVGFLAYTDIVNAGIVRLPDKPTVAGLEPDEIPAQIRRAKAACDVLVVSMHWGGEYMKIPSERQRTLAHTCIDNGADLILGHHPHVLQPVEVYKGKPIAHSLGAFVWDAKIFGANHSEILLFELRKGSAKLIRTLPVLISGCRPALSEKPQKPPKTPHPRRYHPEPNP